MRPDSHTTALLALLATCIVSLGCAKMTPSSEYSGWRPDKKATGKRVDERVAVVPLSAQDLAAIRDRVSQFEKSGMEPESVPVAIAASAARFIVEQALGLIAQDVERAAALHVSTYNASAWRKSFYADPKMGSQMKYRGIWVTREVLLEEAECPGKLPAILVVPANAAARQPRRIWCRVMGLAIEFDTSMAEKNGIFSLRLVDRSLDFYRARARVIEPRWYVPWTWYTDSKHNRWYAPTRGEKDFIDELQVSLVLDSLFTDRGSGNREIGETPLVQHTWTFERVKLDQGMQSVRKDGKAGNGPWSRPVPLVPIGRVWKGSPNGRDTFGGATGPFTVGASVTEVDSGAERLGNLAKNIEKSKSKAANFVEDKVEGAVDSSDN